LIDSQGRVTWWKTNVDVLLLEDKLDPKLKDYAKAITYRVQPYKIHHSAYLSPEATSKGIAACKSAAQKEYNYIYTGQNVDVLKFDIQINNKGIRPMPRPTLRLSKDELLNGRSIISEVKKKLKKEKVVIFQPFGRGIEYIDETLIDKTARSFELKDVKAIVKKLQKQDIGVIMMSEFKVDFSDSKLKDEVAIPENVGVRVWAAVIKYADYFLGCDSLGQHLAYAMDHDAVVVTGSTYPINVSYIDVNGFDILDMGEVNREYSPIRILPDERVDRMNENIMVMTDDITTLVVNHVLGKKE
jgi:hypothetical protein